MLRLIFVDLRSNFRVWLGAVVVVGVAALIVALAFSQTETATTLRSATGQVVRNFSTPTTVLTTIAALIILIPVVDLAVRTEQRNYALWQLVGMLPGQIRAVVLAQVVVVAVAGSCIGILSAWPLAQSVLDWVVELNTSLPPISVHFGVATLIGTFVTVVAATVLAGLRGAISAGNTPPLQAIREPDFKSSRMGLPRWILAAVLLVISTLLVFAIGSPSPESETDKAIVGATGLAMFLCITLTALATTLGPLLFPIVLAAWTNVVPARLSASWYLARNACRYRLSQSGAVIAPLVVGTSLASGIYTVFLTAGTALSKGANSDINGNAILTIISGPLLICAVGVAVVIVMTSRARTQEYGQLMAGGATSGLLVMTAWFEALIYVLTAGIIGLIVVGSLSWLIAVGLSNKAQDVHSVIGVAGGGLTLAAGLILLVAAIMPQALKMASKTGAQSLISEDA